MDAKITNEGKHSIVPWLSITWKGELVAHNKDFTRISLLRWGSPANASQTKRANVDDEYANGIIAGITEEHIRPDARVRWSCANLERGTGVISVQTLRELAQLLLERDLFKSFMPGLPKALKKSTAVSTRRRWTKQLFDGISRAMPHLRAELLLSNNLSNRIT